MGTRLVHNRFCSWPHSQVPDMKTSVHVLRLRSPIT